MYTWIPLLVAALLFTGIHLFLSKIVNHYRQMKLTEGEGTIIKCYQEDNSSFYYVEFEINGRSYQKQVVGGYPLTPPYNCGDQVPVGYHIDEKGIVTVFICDERLDEIKNFAMSKVYLSIAIGMYIAAGAFFVYFLLNL